MTLNFHPDTYKGQDLMLAVLARDGVYRSQFETGTSNGGLTAFAGGRRWRWEQRIFGGAYDDADPELRPKYGALNFRNLETGGSPRFGSCHLRLRPHLLARTTFCYPDSHLDPEDFGLASGMDLIRLAEANPLGLEPLDDYIEAHVHGPIRLDDDVEALVLDPCFHTPSIDVIASSLPCPVEWHSGFRITVDRLDECAAYRGEEAAETLAALAIDGAVTPREIGAGRRGGLEPQLLKWAWHCLARFGNPALR